LEFLRTYKTTTDAQEKLQETPKETIFELQDRDISVGPTKSGS